MKLAFSFTQPPSFDDLKKFADFSEKRGGAVEAKLSDDKVVTLYSSGKSSPIGKLFQTKDQASRAKADAVTYTCFALQLLYNGESQKIISKKVDFKAAIDDLIRPMTTDKKSKMTGADLNAILTQYGKLRDKYTASPDYELARPLSESIYSEPSTEDSVYEDVNSPWKGANSANEGLAGAVEGHTYFDLEEEQAYSDYSSIRQDDYAEVSFSRESDVFITSMPGYATVGEMRAAVAEGYSTFAEFHKEEDEPIYNDASTPLKQDQHSPTSGVPENFVSDDESEAVAPSVKDLISRFQQTLNQKI